MHLNYLKCILSIFKQFLIWKMKYFLILCNIGFCSLMTNGKVYYLKISIFGSRETYMLFACHFHSYSMSYTWYMLFVFALSLSLSVFIHIYIYIHKLNQQEFNLRYIETSILHTHTQSKITHTCIHIYIL